MMYYSGNVFVQIILTKKEERSHITVCIIKILGKLMET